MSTNTRKPAVAGMFYPLNKNELIDLIETIDKEEKPRFDKSISRYNIIGGIVPHAGYMYSGYQAVHFFKVLQYSQQEIDTMVILNPNHRGIGPGIAIDGNTSWETPLGQAEIDENFCRELNIPVSSNAHEKEHSGEVMVPLLQYYLDDSIKIAPVSMLDQSYETAASLARNINIAAAETGKKIIIIASNDFSHFVDPNEGYRLDNLAYEKIEKLDAKGVYETVKKNNISICGYGPVMALIEYSRLKHPGAKTKILHRGNSGDVSPSKSVVNYITSLFYE